MGQRAKTEGGASNRSEGGAALSHEGPRDLGPSSALPVLRGSGSPSLPCPCPI